MTIHAHEHSRQFGTGRGPTGLFCGHFHDTHLIHPKIWLNAISSIVLMTDYSPLDLAMSHCYECLMAKNKRPDSLAIVQRAIGRRITWARELVFPNQSECARLLGVDASTLNKIEKGDRAPSVFLIMSLSNRLRVSTDFLLKGVLNGRTDEEMALRLAALHPELVLQQQDMASHMDKSTPCDMQEAPRKQDQDHS